MEQFKKGKNEILDYDIDMETWLGADDVNSCTVEIDKNDLTLQSKSLYDKRVKLWFEGGTANTDYIVTATIGTEMGRTKVIQFKMKVR